MTYFDPSRTGRSTSYRMLGRVVIDAPVIIIDTSEEIAAADARDQSGPDQSPHTNPEN